MSSFSYHFFSNEIYSITESMEIYWFNKAKSAPIYAVELSLLLRNMAYNAKFIYCVCYRLIFIHK